MSEPRQTAGSTPAPGYSTLAGRYELLSLLGVGGMGAVYRVQDLELGEVVALKMLRRELVDDPISLARFRQEVKLARRVTHKNVARTYDLGAHLGDKFLTMEFIDGESLADIASRQRPMPLGRTLEIMGAVCAGLSAAHAAGVVHRDLKPDNVLIARDGRIVITDFGIARLTVGSGGAVVKTLGVPIGTPAYMAPEQVEGSPNIDSRADLYALGAILYELLTGVRAWGGDSVYSVAAKRLVCPPPDPRLTRSDVPDGVAQIALRCMARRAEDRFSSAAEVAAALVSVTLPMPRPTLPPESLPPAPTQQTPGAGKTVAVLPFRNAGPPEDEYIADGFTDDLIDGLSMTRGLRVRPRGAVLALKGVERDPRDLGAKLGVQVVVEGSVRRTGDRLRINARVMSVTDGFQLWAKRFDGAASDVLAVSDELAKAVASALTCNPGTALRHAATDPAAIDLYLRARHAYLNGWQDNVSAAIGLFEQALARAPDDAMILAGYAMALMRRATYDEDTERLAKLAKDAADRALAIAPNLGQARLALALCLLATGDGPGAALELRQVLTDAPDLADAHDMLGRMLIEAGAVDEGIARLRAAMAIDPRFISGRWEIARARALLGDDTGYVEDMGEEPEDPGSATIYWICRLRGALWRRGAGLDPDALEAAKKRGATFPGLHALMRVLMGEVSGQDVARLLQARLGGSSRKRMFFSQLRAEMAAFGHDTGCAMEALLDADAAQLFDVAWMDGCPLLAPLRSDPRFAVVRRSVGDRAGKVLEALGTRPRQSRAPVR